MVTILKEESLKALGCSQEQTYKGNTAQSFQIQPLATRPIGPNDGFLYIPVQSVDFFSNLKNSPDSLIGKVYYEKPEPSADQIFKPFGGKENYPMNKQFYQLMESSNQGRSMNQILGKDYQGVSGQPLFDVQYTIIWLNSHCKFNGSIFCIPTILSKTSFSDQCTFNNPFRYYISNSNNDILMRVAGNGWGTTGFAPLGVARIDIVATENYTDSARGSKIIFYNVPNGSNVVNQIASFNADRIDFTGVVSPEKGFIYTPRILGAQTAITIDFANDSMIRTTYSSTLTISFSNYTYGKVVELWVTNTAGTGQTINLGVLANNSTTGSTTLSVASQRSAKLQYFSIDGDLANTFCAITYA